MKLLFSPYHEPLPLPEGACGALVVEAPRAFRRLVADLRAQLDGAAGACVLSHEGRVLDMARCLELFVDFVPFPCNRRTLLARALGALERQAAVEPAQLHAALLPLTAYLLELCGEYGLTLEPEKLTVSSLLKLAGACIGEPPAAPGAPGPPDTLCAILGYLDLVAQLEREKLFVFVNARSYFAQEELAAFVTAARTRKHRLLLLDGRPYPLLPGERRVLLDEDLCELRAQDAAAQAPPAPPQGPPYGPDGLPFPPDVL